MLKRKLYYGSLLQSELNQDVFCSVFHDNESLLNELKRVLDDNEDAGITPVYLLSCDENLTMLCEYSSNIFVTDTDGLIYSTVEEMLSEPSILDSVAFHLQEYKSYEDAYKVALNMMENHPLCYSK